jgi:hypothetical protein
MGMLDAFVSLRVPEIASHASLFAPNRPFSRL